MGTTEVPAAQRRQLQGAELTAELHPSSEGPMLMLKL